MDATEFWPFFAGKTKWGEKKKGADRKDNALGILIRKEFPCFKLFFLALVISNKCRQVLKHFVVEYAVVEVHTV